MQWNEVCVKGIWENFQQPLNDLLLIIHSELDINNKETVTPYFRVFIYRNSGIPQSAQHSFRDTYLILPEFIITVTNFDVWLNVKQGQ